MRKMTITEALVELKLLDKRIVKADIGEWCAIKTKSQNKVLGNKTVDEYTNDTIAKYQSMTALIKERADIKAAIVKSNAKTEVVVGDMTMTVADAIEYKTSIGYEKALLNSLKASKASIEQRRVDHENRLEREIVNVIGKLAESGKENLSQEQKDFTESYRKMNEAEIIDPIGIDKCIEELEKKIDDFEQNIDVVLSVSNATTFIEV